MNRPILVSCILCRRHCRSGSAAGKPVQPLPGNLDSSSGRHASSLRPRPRPSHRPGILTASRSACADVAAGSGGQSADANLVPVAMPIRRQCSGDGTDDGIVQVAQPPAATRAGVDRALIRSRSGWRYCASAPLGPGELGEGTINSRRVAERSFERAAAKRASPFAAAWPSDVMQGGQVLIPAARRSTAEWLTFRPAISAAMAR